MVRRPLITAFCVASLLAGQLPPGPVGMKGGGNETVQFAKPIRASSVYGVVVDPSGASIPNALIQLQPKNSSDILPTENADAKGRFRLPHLRAGEYWLGITSPGFNLHVWDLRITHSGSKKLKAVLSLGT